MTNFAVFEFTGDDVEQLSVWMDKYGAWDFRNKFPEKCLCVMERHNEHVVTLDYSSINHKEAYELACMKKDTSNLAKCYLDLRNAYSHADADQKLGEVVWKFIDRMQDICEECDPADKIIHDFLVAIDPILAEWNQKLIENNE